MNQTSANGRTIISITGNPNSYSWYRNLGGVFFEVVDMLDYFMVLDIKNNEETIVSRGFAGYLPDLEDGELNIPKADAIVIATPSNAQAVDPQKELEAQILAMKSPQEAAPVENAPPEKEVKPEHEKLMRALGHNITEIKTVQEPVQKEVTEVNQHDELLRLLGHNKKSNSTKKRANPYETMYVAVTYDTVTSWYLNLKDVLFEVYKNEPGIGRRSYLLADTKYNREVLKLLPNQRTQYGYLIDRLSNKSDAHPLFIKKHHARKTEVSNHQAIHRLDNGTIPMSL